MSEFINPPFGVRNGRRLQVLLICRVSNPRPGAQTEQSNDDQAATFEEWVRKRTDLPSEFTVLAGKGSGERLDREEVRKAEDLVESGRYDLVVAEDLGRIMRRVQAFGFCERCEDHDTRLIAPNDHVDSGGEGWRLAAFFAVMRHESYNADTAKRIRRTHRNRFMQGGVVQGFPYGYTKPSGCKRDAAVDKDPTAEPIYDEWFRMLEGGAGYSEVADWLNEQRIPTEPYCREESWTGPMVRRITFNPILKGIRVRNRVKSKRINKTGRRKSIKADPSELLERHCPHFAFIDPERYDRVIRLLKTRNAKYARKKTSGVDPRKNTPNKRTKWPGQHIVCGVYGRQMFFAGRARRTTRGGTSGRNKTPSEKSSDGVT